MNSELTFNFEGENIVALDVNTVEPVFIASPVAKKLGYESAKDMLRSLDDDEKGRHIVPTPGGPQEMSVITLPGLIHALNNRRPGAVKDETVRNMIIRFQRWVNHEVIPQIIHTGRYQSESMRITAHEEHMNRLSLLQLAKGIVHPDYLEAKARIVIADEFGELPEIDPGRRPLTVADYLKEKGLSDAELKSTQSVFGKKLKHAYRDKYGHDPMKTDIEVKGRIRPVYAYTEADRLLFDTVYTSMQEHRLAA